MIDYFQDNGFNIASTVLLYIALILLIFFIVDHFKLIPVFKKLLIYLKKYLFIFFIIPAIGFLFMDFFYDDFKNHKNYLFLKDLCTVLFSAGVFTTALNFLDSLDVFKKNFKDIIMSPEFDTLLTSKFDALAYSEEHLNKQSNLEKIWQTVTLCKYRKEFPELYAKLENKIENLLFKKNNISYYYKNFQVSYEVDLEEDLYIINIERCSFTIVRPNTEDFDFDFGTGYNNEDDKAYSDAKFSFKNTPDEQLTTIDSVPVIEGNITRMLCSHKLGGYLEYHIESTIIHKQNIDNDRIMSFGSARIIDDLTVQINHTDKICVTFVPVNGNKLYHNGTHATNKMAYINRDVLLSGEKFIMFFYRKQ